MIYVLAHHWLEGAENAARHRDTITLNWYRTSVAPVLARLIQVSRRGPRIVIAPGDLAREHAALTLPAASTAGHAVLADHLRQQHARLDAARDDFTRALEMISDAGLRERLDYGFQHARAV
ncbi:hypothetical protein [Streptomyces murinus]|uniref:hypothetical protein n=1 Tax=Streptomyces murinus TaxID=33900 RepID=UPI0037F7D948